MVDVVLIRHGQSGNNLLWERTGASRGRSPDPELTPLGLEQAAAVAEAFARNEFGSTPTQLWTSLMIRAVQTAAPLAEALDLPLTGHEQTFEYYGPVEIDPDDPERMWPYPGAARTDLAALTTRLTLPGSATEQGWWTGPVEDPVAADARAQRVVAELREQPASEVVALVTHGTFSVFLIRALLGVSEMSGWLRINNTAVSRFSRLDAGGPVVAEWINRTSHLRPDLISN